MSKKSNRINQIINTLKEANGASVKELAQEFEVSEMTIRRDLKLLEEKKIIDNFYGAAVYNPREDNPLNSSLDFDIDYDINLNSRMMEIEKSKIGKKAAELIEENDIVVIDIGTTTEKLSQNVKNDINFTALLYSANNLMRLIDKKNVKIILSGGYLHRDTGMFDASESTPVMKNTRATKMFLSAAGIHDRLGVTCAYNYETEIKKEMVNNSLEVILLADSSKFGSVKQAFICELEDIDKIITDSHIDDRWKQIIEEKDVELIIV